MSQPIISEIEVDKKAFKTRGYEYAWLANNGFKLNKSKTVGSNTVYPQSTRKVDPKQKVKLAPTEPDPEEGLVQPSHVVFVVQAPSKRKGVVPSVKLAPKTTRVVHTAAPKAKVSDKVTPSPKVIKTAVTPVPKALPKGTGAKLSEQIRNHTITPKELGEKLSKLKRVDLVKTGIAIFKTLNADKLYDRIEAGKEDPEELDKEFSKLYAYVVSVETLVNKSKEAKTEYDNKLLSEINEMEIIGSELDRQIKVKRKASSKKK